MLDKSELKVNFNDALAQTFLLSSYLSTKRCYIESVKFLIKSTITGHTQRIISSAYIVAEAKDKYITIKNLIKKYRGKYYGEEKRK